MARGFLFSFLEIDIYSRMYLETMAMPNTTRWSVDYKLVT